MNQSPQGAIKSVGGFQGETIDWLAGRSYASAIQALAEDITLSESAALTEVRVKLASAAKAPGEPSRASSNLKRRAAAAFIDLSGEGQAGEAEAIEQ